MLPLFLEGYQGDTKLSPFLPGLDNSRYYFGGFLSLLTQTLFLL